MTPPNSNDATPATRQPPTPRRPPELAVTPAQTESAENESNWRAQTPIGEVQIARTDAGHWNVLYRGFSRSANPSLAAALAEATGTSHQTAWLLQLAGTIEGRTASDVR